MGLRIFGDVVAYLFEYRCVVSVVGVVYYHLFLKHVSLCAYAEYASEEEFICVDVKHHGVAVCLVGEEDGQRHENHHRYPSSEEHSPVVVACHSHAREVEDVIDDEDEYGYDHRHAESSFSDDGS